MELIGSKLVYVNGKDLKRLLNGSPIYVFVKLEGEQNETNYMRMESKYLTVKYKIDNNKFEVVYTM